MHSCRIYVLSLLCMACWGGGLLADSDTKTIREELKEMLSEQGYSEGVDRRARSVVGIGISWSDKEPELVARAVATWRIVCQLDGANLSAMRNAHEDGQGEKVSLSVKKVSEGFLLGAREVARVTRKGENDKLAVGIALRWTLSQELSAAESLTVPMGEQDALSCELRGMKHLERMGGAQVWMCGGSPAVWLLGIGVMEVKSDRAIDICNAMRLAQLKARRYLSLHLCQYNRDEATLKRDLAKEDDQSCLSSDLDTLHILKSKGVVGAAYGISDVYEQIVYAGERRYAICVTCLSGPGGEGLSVVKERRRSVIASFASFKCHRNPDGALKGRHAPAL